MLKGDIGIFVSGVCFDLALENGDFKRDEGLQTAVTISLFTERRVTKEQLPPGITNQKGWWGDMLPEKEGDLIGSRLWTLRREKRTTETLRRAEDYTLEALKWLKEEGVSNSITAAASFDEKGFLNLDIGISRPNDETSRFLAVWEAQSVVPVEQAA